MELTAKKINFLGDSITEGVGTSQKDNIYLNILKKECSLAEARNYGKSGTRIARQIMMTDDPFDQDFLMRAEKMADDADIIVVFGGTNDFGHGDAPFGEFDSRASGCIGYFFINLNGVFVILKRFENEGLCRFKTAVNYADESHKGSEENNYSENAS